MKLDFITCIEHLAEIVNEVRVGLNDPYKDYRRGREALKAAGRALAKASAEISDQALVLDMEASKGLQDGLDALLGREGVSRVAAVKKALMETFHGKEPLSSLLPIVDRQKAKRAGTDERTFDTPYHDLGVLLSVLERLVSNEIRALRSQGGRQRDRIRWHIHKELLELHDSIFSKPATSAPNGTYGRLCQHVFDSFDMSTDGLEEAIKRFLRPTATSRNERSSRS